MFNMPDIIEINKQFDKGKLVNKSSLEFAISQSKTTKDWIKQLAYLVRAILIDHVFEEGNKRTASALIMAYMEIHKIGYDPKKVDKLIVETIKKNTTSIMKIRMMIKDATW